MAPHDRLWIDVPLTAAVVPNRLDRTRRPKPPATIARPTMTTSPKSPPVRGSSPDGSTETVPRTSGTTAALPGTSPAGATVVSEIGVVGVPPPGVPGSPGGVVVPPGGQGFSS